MNSVLSVPSVTRKKLSPVHVAAKIGISGFEGRIFPGALYTRHFETIVKLNN
jgi:hypothetical protein